MITFKQYLDEGLRDPGIFKAIFLAGGSGVGKSYVAGKTTGGHGLKIVNSDDIFEFLLTKTDIPLDMLKATPEMIAKRDVVRGKAKSLLGTKQLLFLKGRLGMIIDGTARDYNKIKQQKGGLDEIGYDTFMIFVNTSMETALERNRKRPRKVPEDVVIRNWNNVQKNMGKFQNLFGNQNFVIVDNNSPSEDVFKKTSKDITKFVKKPVKNKLAKAWMGAEMERLGITKF